MIPFLFIFFVPFYLVVCLGWGIDEAEIIRKDIF